MRTTTLYAIGILLSVITAFSTYINPKNQFYQNQWAFWIIPATAFVLWFLLIKKKKPKEQEEE